MWDNAILDNLIFSMVFFVTEFSLIIFLAQTETTNIRILMLSIYS